MESNLYSPKNQVRLDLNSLEGFWKSSAPKFGNEGAVGWREYFKNRKESDDSEEEEPCVDEDQVRLFLFAQQTFFYFLIALAGFSF